MSTSATSNVPPHDETAPADGVLVDPGWLEAHLHDPSVRVVEVDVGRAHDQWHIDGATAWNVYADLKDPGYQLAGAPAVRRLFERSGITPDTTVVFYGYAPAVPSCPPPACASSSPPSVPAAT
jgi:thiosulfate/3-mercaptopyruvate sulfurtransferase